jgi:hypothetical protein
VPLVPVTVTVAAPTGADAEAARVSRLLVPVVEAGANDALTPAGRPVADSATMPVKLVRTIAIVLVPLAPRATDRLDGLAESVNVAAWGVAATGLEFTLSPTPLTALTTKKYVVPFVSPVFVNDVPVAVPTVAYGPPLVVARLTL